MLMQIWLLKFQITRIFTFLQEGFTSLLKIKLHTAVEKFRVVKIFLYIYTFERRCSRLQLFDQIQ